MTHDEAAREFSKQVKLCSTIGKAAMLEIVNRLEVVDMEPVNASDAELIKAKGRVALVRAVREAPGAWLHDIFKACIRNGLEGVPAAFKPGEPGRLAREIEDRAQARLPE